MLLTDFASKCTSRSSWIGVSSQEHGVHEATTQDDHYVVPEVTVVDSCAPIEPSALLITAPAAVGKTTASRFLSYFLKAPILDLSDLQVGHGTLEGTLSKALGLKKYAEFLGGMLAGDSTLIIDALDEAEVRSGQANFQAFIRGVIGTASEIANGPALILLSRAESAQSIERHLKEGAVPYIHLEILPFNKEQSEKYISDRLEVLYQSSGRACAHLKHPEPYVKARDAIISSLAAPLIGTGHDFWNDPSVRSFVGYAPVLDVVAEYLSVDNFAALQQSFSSAAEEPSGLVQWRLIAEVIDGLLVREQKKFCDQFSKNGEYQGLDDDSLVSVLYSGDEQCARLLGYVENLSTPIALPATLPEQLRSAYETSVDVQLLNHPFLRGPGWFNVIFRDYVLARSLTAPTTTAETANEIRKRLLSTSWMHSPMFGYFTYALTVSNGTAACHSEEVGILYESFKSVCEAHEKIYLMVTRIADRLGVSIARIDHDSDFSLVMGPLHFHSHVGTQSISFPRELSFVHVFNVPEVTLGGASSSIKLGPDVVITCKDLLVAASELRVFVNENEPPVVLEARNIMSENAKITSGGAHDLIVISPGATYPWSSFQVDALSLFSESGHGEGFPLYLELRKIVLRFKDAKRGQAAAFKPLLDNLVIGGNRRAQVALDYLQDIGCITLTGSMYLLDLGEFAKLGIPWPQLRNIKFSEPVRKLVDELGKYHESKKRQS